MFRHVHDESATAMDEEAAEMRMRAGDLRKLKKIEASKLINEHARSFTTGRGLDITMPVNKVVNVLPVTKPEVLFSPDTQERYTVDGQIVIYTLEHVYSALNITFSQVICKVATSFTKC